MYISMAEMVIMAIMAKMAIYGHNIQKWSMKDKMSKEASALQEYSHELQNLLKREKRKKLTTAFSPLSKLQSPLKKLWFSNEKGQP